MTDALAADVQRLRITLRKAVPSMAESLAMAERLASAALMTSPAAKRRLQARSIALGATETDQEHDSGHDSETEDYSESFVPPRDVLLYLVRMGSFSSTVRVENADSQDDGLSLPQEVAGNSEEDARLQLLTWCLSQLKNSPARLLHRAMRPVRRLPYAVKGESPSSIRVVQWNVLSQSLGQHNDGFVRCPADALQWSVRRALILQELANLRPDIICLQEVDHFKLLQRTLAPLGYHGLFHPKPDSPCLYLPDNNGPDGCALFWRTKRFQLVCRHDAVLRVWRIESNQVVLAARLREISTGAELCVASTHLKARQGALMAQLRLEQGKDLARFMASRAAGAPVLLCGDFNAEPSEPVYRAMLGHRPLGLASAYSVAASNGADFDPDRRIGTDKLDNPDQEEVISDPVAHSASYEPSYTTWKVRGEGEQKHTIDYIFFSKKNFSVRSVLQLPSADEVGEDRLPSWGYPSDHLAIAADLELHQTPVTSVGDERSH